LAQVQMSERQRRSYEITLSWLMARSIWVETDSFS
jgi:hypothetical protein